MNRVKEITERVRKKGESKHRLSTVRVRKRAKNGNEKVNRERKNTERVRKERRGVNAQ